MHVYAQKAAHTRARTNTSTHTHMRALARTHACPYASGRTPLPAAALATMRSVLAARLPRAFDETGAGVAAVDEEERVVGVAVNHDAIASAGLEMKQRLTDEVIFPLQQWLAAYRSIKARGGAHACAHVCMFACVCVECARVCVCLCACAFVCVLAGACACVCGPWGRTQVNQKKCMCICGPWARRSATRRLRRCG